MIATAAIAALIWVEDIAPGGPENTPVAAQRAPALAAASAADSVNAVTSQPAGAPSPAPVPVQPEKTANPVAQPARPVIEYKVVKGYEILDSQTFGDETATFELADIETPPPFAICVDEQGFRWACGLQARASLNNILKKAPTLCRGARLQSTTITGHCTNAEGDVATQMVAAGFARSNGKTPAYAAAEAQARTAKRGMWRNNWTIVQR